MVCEGNCKNGGQCSKKVLEKGVEKADDVWHSDSESVEPEVDQSEEFGVVYRGESFEVANLRRKHAKQGYLDGLSRGKETDLQKGFDDAYSDGAELGMQVGRILGRLYMEKKDESALEELAIKKVLSEKYFDGDMNLLSQPHELVKKWG